MLRPVDGYRALANGRPGDDRRHDRLHYNNGIGRGASPDEVVITSTASGDVYLATLRGSETTGEVEESFHLDSSIDNLSYITDQYATSPGDDKSGYVIPGLAKVATLLQSAHDPNAKELVIAWLAGKDKGGSQGFRNTTVPFEDDRSRTRSAGGAVLAGIDPTLEGGRKRAWLFVKGFFSGDKITVKIDL